MGVMRMMAKKKSLAVVVAMAAMTATTAVPAFAQQDGEVAAHPVGPAEGGQYAPAGPTQQEALPALAPVSGTAAGGEQYVLQAAPRAGEEFSGVGVVESLGADGRYGLRLGGLEGQELRGDFDFAAFEGETVRVSGRFAIDESRGRVLQVESIELAQEEGEQTTVTGVFSVEEGGFSFVTDEETGQEYYLVGTIGLDPQATAGKRVVAKGVAECGYDGPVYGCTLGVSSIELVAAEPPAPTDEAPSDERILPFEVPAPDKAEDGASPERRDGTGAAYDKGGAVVSGDTNNAPGGAVVSGDTNDDKGGVPVVSGDTDDVNGGGSGVESGSPTPGGKAQLPATGGLLPVAGVGGALLLVGWGLFARRFAR